MIAVPLGNVLHLKSAVTALPDGTFLLLPHLVPAGLFPAIRPSCSSAATCRGLRGDVAGGAAPS